MIKAKKSLGQNFLIDENIIDKIVNIIELKNKNILEIGPGTGNLTEGILKKNPKKILVVEKDDNLTNLLREKFKDKVEVINQDILMIDENLLSDQKKLFEYFDIIEKITKEKEQLNLIKIKKALYLIKSERDKEGKNILEKISNSNSKYKNTRKTY